MNYTRKCLVAAIVGLLGLGAGAKLLHTSYRFAKHHKKKVILSSAFYGLLWYNDYDTSKYRSLVTQSVHATVSALHDYAEIRANQRQEHVKKNEEINTKNYQQTMIDAKTAVVSLPVASSPLTSNPSFNVFTLLPNSSSLLPALSRSRQFSTTPPVAVVQDKAAQEQPRQESRQPFSSADCKTDTFFYIVKMYDNLANISQQISGSRGNYSILAADNHIADPEKIIAGQVISVRKSMSVNKEHLMPCLPDLQPVLLAGTTRISDLVQGNKEKLEHILALNHGLGLHYDDTFPYRNGARIVYIPKE